MNRRFIITGLAAVSAVVAVLFFLPGSEEDIEQPNRTQPSVDSASSLRQTATKPPSTNVLTAFSQTEQTELNQTAAAPVPQQIELTEPVRHILRLSIDCYLHIEGLKRQMADKGGNVSRTLNGLQSKLFRDDWNVAGLNDKRFSDTDSEAAFQHLKESIETGGDPDVESMLAASNFAASPLEETDHSATTSLTDHYQIRIQGRIQGFGLVAEALQNVTGSDDYLQNDLLKDAWCYAAAMTMLDQRYQDAQLHFERQQREISDFTGQLDEAGLNNWKIGSAHVAQSITRDIENIEAAYESVFRWRFSEVHGLDPNILLGVLDEISLSRPSPVDLSIPVAR